MPDDIDALTPAGATPPAPGWPRWEFFPAGDETPTFARLVSNDGSILIEIVNLSGDGSRAHPSPLPRFGLQILADLEFDLNFGSAVRRLPCFVSVSAAVDAVNAASKNPVWDSESRVHQGPSPQPFAGETIGDYNARLARLDLRDYRIDLNGTPHLTVEHKFDPWLHRTDDKSAAPGGWVPNDAMMTSPSGPLFVIVDAHDVANSIFVEIEDGMGVSVGGLPETQDPVTGYRRIQVR